MLAYDLDAEYGIDTKEYRTPSGDKYNALDFSSREVHLFSASANYYCLRYWLGEAYVGYAFDRLGKNSPHFGLCATYQDREHLEIRFAAERSYVATGEGDTFDSITASVKWKF